MDRGFLLQNQVRNNAEDLRTYMKDLKLWESDMKRKESELQAIASGDQLPPIRSKIRKSSKGLKSKPDEKPGRISGSDYVSWDKFDVDKTCKDLEDQKQESEDDDDNLSGETERLREEAIYEKEKGNDFVKNQKWKEAIQCYSRAIKCYPYDAIFYANRALCYLKIEELRSAEADATTALQLDSSYVKAYQRRAAARIGLGQLQEAKADLLNVMKIEPNNVASKGELAKLEVKIMNFKGKNVSTSAGHSKKVDNQKTEKEKEIKHKKLVPETEKRSLSTGNGNRHETHTSSEVHVSKKHGKGDTRKSHSNKGISTVEKDKKHINVTNQETVEQHSSEHVEIVQTQDEVKLVQAIYKPPHLRSKKAHKRIEIFEVDNLSAEKHHHKSTSSLAKRDKPKTDTEISKSVEKKQTGHHKEEKSTDKNTHLLSEVTGSLEIPPVPNTSVQFLVSWKKVRSDHKLSYLYLKQIPGSELARIFQESLESSTLSDIISTLQTGFLQSEEPVLPYLEGLTNVRRFTTLVMFLSEKDKAGLRKILEYCKARGEGSKEEIGHLKKKFEL